MSYNFVRQVPYGYYPQFFPMPYCFDNKMINYNNVSNMSEFGKNEKK